MKNLIILRFLLYSVIFYLREIELRLILTADDENLKQFKRQKL